MYMDPEFNCLDKIIAGTDINTTAAIDHFLEIEWQIQLIKESMHAVHGVLPYVCMTIWMVIELGNYVVMMLNVFPPKSGMLQAYSPCNIMTGKNIYFKKKCL